MTRTSGVFSRVASQRSQDDCQKSLFFGPLGNSFKIVAYSEEEYPHMPNDTRADPATRAVPRVVHAVKPTRSMPAICVVFPATRIICKDFSSGLLTCLIYNAITYAGIQVLKVVFFEKVIVFDLVMNNIY